jgi:hypothetical protein
VDATQPSAQDRRAWAIDGQPRMALTPPAEKIEKVWKYVCRGVA